MRMSKKLIFGVSLFMIGFMACKKKDDIICDNAELQIKNIGNDTIRYSFNSNAQNMILLPGATLSEFVGPIKITDETENTVITTFESDHGNYVITVDNCVVMKEIK